MPLKPGDIDSQREKLLARKAALSIASGKTDAETCEDLSISKGVLKVLKESPLFQESIDNYAKEIEKAGVENIVADLQSDFPKNRDFITSVRDGRFDEPRDRMQLRLQAAKMLLDKQAPNAAERSSNEQAARIIIDGRMLGQVLRAMRNAGAIDIEVEEIEKATGETVLQLEAKTPEQYAEEYAERKRREDEEADS